MDTQSRDLYRKIRAYSNEHFSYYAPELFYLNHHKIFNMFEYTVQPHPYFQHLLDPSAQFQFSVVVDELKRDIGPLMANCFLHYWLIKLYVKSVKHKEEVNKNIVHILKITLRQTISVDGLRFPWEKKPLWWVEWDLDPIDWHTAMERLRSNQYPLKKLVLTNPLRQTVQETYEARENNMFLHTFGDYDEEGGTRILDAGTPMPARQILHRMEEIETRSNR